MIYDESTVNKIVANYSLPKLHLDLQPYLFKDELHHPLVSLEGGVYPRLYQRINKLYTYKKEQSIKPLPSNTWQAYLPHLPAHERIMHFMTEELKILRGFSWEIPEYFQLIGQIWTDPELLGQASCFLELRLGVFDRRPLSEHAHHMMTPTEQDKLAELPNEFIVFRGHAERLLHGMSWTTSCDIALQYAIGNPLKSLISIGTVKKLEVIAFIDRWDEMRLLFRVVLLIIFRRSDMQE